MESTRSLSESITARLNAPLKNSRYGNDDTQKSKYNAQKPKYNTQKPKYNAQKPKYNQPKKIKEKIPDAVSQMVVEEVLRLVGDSDWNDPLNVSKTIAKMMSIDLSKPLENQAIIPCDIDRTVFVSANKTSNVPVWICQSIIRVDEKFNNRYIDYKGAKYNKIDVVFESEYFKNEIEKVAKAAGCIAEYRWGNAKREENKLYQKTRTGSTAGEESWLDKCVKPLLTDEDTDGINIKNLIMISFKRDTKDLI